MKQTHHLDLPLVVLLNVRELADELLLNTTQHNMVVDSPVEMEYNKPFPTLICRESLFVFCTQFHVPCSQKLRVQDGS